MRRVGALLLSSAVVVSCLSGCEGCGVRGDAIAVLVSTSGSVERDLAARAGEWLPAELEAAFRLGDGARALDKSSAVLRLAGDAELHLGENTAIRFLDHAPSSGGVGLEIASGEAELVAGSGDLNVRIGDVGDAVILGGSRVRLRRSPSALSVRVEIGAATITSKGGERRELAAGARYDVEIGDVEIVGAGGAGAAPVAAADGGAGGDPGGTIAVTVRGDGVRVRDGGGTGWRELGAGEAEVSSESELSLPEGADVDLHDALANTTLHGAGEFRLGAGRARLEIRGGGAHVESGPRAVTVVVPGGRLVALSGFGGGTAADLSTKGPKTEISILRGAAELHRGNEVERLSAGQNATLVGGGRAEAVGPRFVAGPAVADLSVRAGESFTVHAVAPPVVVAFELGGACPAGAVLTLAGAAGGVTGRGAIRAELPLGKSAYRVRCTDASLSPVGDIVASGRAFVVRDAGRAPLPARPPVSAVETDGREYVISYQNLLPTVRVAWPKAPKADSYVLAMRSPGRAEQRFVTTSPERAFPSGTLGEGRHTAVFEAAGGGASRPTAIVIEFDNAAPKAYVQAPDDGGFSSGEAVEIRGVVIPGWKVSSTAGDVTTDAHNRFFGTVPFDGSYRGIAVRLAHRDRGIHYYLRRGRADSL